MEETNERRSCTPSEIERVCGWSSSSMWAVALSLVVGLVLPSAPIRGTPGVRTFDPSIRMVAAPPGVADKKLIVPVFPDVCEHTGITLTSCTPPP